MPILNPLIFSILSMKRRTFTKLTSAGILLPSLEIKRGLVFDQSEVKTLLTNLIVQNDSRIPDPIPLGDIELRESFIIRATIGSRL